jgi:acyl-CoA thioester hydrolase
MEQENFYVAFANNYCFSWVFKAIIAMERTVKNFEHASFLDTMFYDVYNFSMTEFNFSIPVEVRYGDLDPQWHVNNSRFLTYLESARMGYLMSLDLFDGENFFDFNMIVADIHISYLAPIKFSQKVRVWIRAERLGRKSLTFVYEIRDEDTRQVLASAETIMVTFDYHQQKSIPVPEKWRSAISQREGVDFSL